MTSCADCLADTQPAILPRSSGNSELLETTMHQKTALRTAGFLALMLDPDLEGSLTPGALLAANNSSIFQLLPLIVAAIKRIGETSSNRDNFVRLVSIFRNRIVACRGLKLRFLLLVQNDAFAAQWDVRMVHRRYCYATARKYLEELSQNLDAMNESNEVIRVANVLECKESKGVSSGNTATTTSSISFDLKPTKSEDAYKKLGNGVIDTNGLISFAATSLFHKDNGIKLKKIVFRFRTIKSAFYGSELVDGIMERSTFRSREDAIAIAQRILDVGLIYKVASTSRRFHDDKRTVFQCYFSLHRDDDGQCKVITENGYELSSWDAVTEDNSKQIKQIGLQIPMDMIDLQSFEFWTKTVYVRGVEKGYRYGYRAIAHPLYCRGVDSFSNLDFSTVQGRVKHDKAENDYDVRIDDGNSNDIDKGNKSNTDVNSNENENENDGVESINNSDDGLSQINSAASSSNTIISTQEINDLYQESAVIGSVIVEKVFSSVARPMIIQLRVPIENADLEEDDHHIVLHPGLLVKEGDNLMQDLSVEIMFQCFNHIWSHTPSLKKKYGVTPESISYGVFPTSSTQGFMEALTGLTSLKEYDWFEWKKKYGQDETRVNEMLRTTVGSYVGTYIVGGRDRHFDNVLVKDDNQLLHIDFGFVMGNNPPIDGPPIAIAPEMELVFKELNVWKKFTDLFVDSFMALRERAPAIVRTSVLLFSKAGFNDDNIRAFLKSKGSLNSHENDQKAMDFIRKQLLMSSGDIKTRFKQFAHKHIDPAWYGLLEKGFPPAVAIMKIVDAKDNKAAKKLALTRKLSLQVPEDERINVKL